MKYLAATKKEAVNQRQTGERRGDGLIKVDVWITSINEPETLHEAAHGHGGALK